VRDLGAVLAFVADAHDTDGPEALTRELLDRLAALVGCTYASYEEYDWSRRVVSAYVACSNEDPLAVLPPYVPPEFWTADEWPFVSGAPFEKVSDRLDRRERERIRDEEEFNAEFRIVDSIGFGVGDRRTRSGWLHFDSEGRDFDERDRELALALRPHVEALWRKAASRRRLAELLAELDRDGETTPHAVVLLGARGRIDQATAGAQRLLAEWFGVRDRRLPSELRDWLALARYGDRYTVRRNGSILTVESAGDSTLTLRTRTSVDAGLTPREREVLALVAEGLSNTEIAGRMWVAPSTVAKHLEQAYRKLGVRSRTAAVARLARLPD
jgi:DNA-binding CsgD family transcriptional regulator/GAF domain-containing protein